MHVVGLIPLPTERNDELVKLARLFFGGGIIRDTIELTMAEPDMNVDIVAFGPLLIGGNAGYAVPIGGSLRFNAEFSALAGLPVVSKLGESVLNLGVQLDVSLGLSVGF